MFLLTNDYMNMGKQKTNQKYLQKIKSGTYDHDHITMQAAIDGSQICLVYQNLLQNSK